MSDMQSLASQVQQLEQSYNQWNSITLCFVAGTAIVATFYFIASYITNNRAHELKNAQSRLIEAKEEQLARDSKTKDEQIATARADAAKATEKAEEAKLEQEKLKRENLELEKLLLPRPIRIKPETLEQLRQFTGTPILIWAAPDFEATRFADRLGEMLQAADWQVTRDDISPRSLFGAALPDNVTIITRSDVPPSSETIDRDKSLSAAEAVLTFMKFSEVEAIKIQNTDIPNLAWDGVCVIVGVKSASAIVMRRLQERWKD